MATRALVGLRRHAFAGAVGFAGGACVGLVGWGGAQFIVPGMTHPFMGHTQLAATGISLCSLSLSTTSSAAKWIMSDSVSWPQAAAIALPAIVTARLGTRFAAKISNDALELIFNGLSLLLIPTHLLVQRHAKQRDGDDNAATAAPKAIRKTLTEHQQGTPSGASLSEQLASIRPLDLAFGCVSGAISSLMGVGGLPLTMSYLTAFTSLPHHLVQGTAVLAVAPSILTSALSRIHVVPLATGAVVSAGAVGGAAMGASVALRTPEERLRELYMLSLVLLGGRSFVRAGQNLRTILSRRQGT